MLFSNKSFVAIILAVSTAFVRALPAGNFTTNAAATARFPYGTTKVRGVSIGTLTAMFQSRLAALILIEDGFSGGWLVAEVGVLSSVVQA